MRVVASKPQEMKGMSVLVMIVVVEGKRCILIASPL